MFFLMYTYWNTGWFKLVSESNQMFGKSSGDTPDFFSYEGSPDCENGNKIS